MRMIARRVARAVLLALLPSALASAAVAQAAEASGDWNTPRVLDLVERARSLRRDAVVERDQPPSRRLRPRVRAECAFAPVLTSSKKSRMASRSGPSSISM